MNEENGSGKVKKGFAALSPERRREISSKGGKRAHELGVGHTFSREEARLAGSKGGKASRKKPKEGWDRDPNDQGEKSGAVGQ